MKSFSKILFDTKKIIALSLVFAVFISPIFANKAQAQWVVFDPTNFTANTLTVFNTAVTGASSVVTAANTTVAGPVKEFGLDTIAWVLVNLVIERISASTVNWINSGFKGSPAFITNPEGYFKDLGNKVAGEYIFRNPDLNFLCGPLTARVKIALSKAYIGNRNFSCKLTDVKGNIDNFMNDFERGSWEKFFTISQDQTQSPLGIYIEAEGTLIKRLTKYSNQKDKELAWGKGFLSKKTCAVWEQTGFSTTDDDDQDFLKELDSSGSNTTGGEDLYGIGEDAEGNAILPDSPAPDTNTQGNNVRQPKCLKEETITPGSVISDKLNGVLGISDGKLAVADEINEIVSALLNQLVGRIVGGIGAGLRGISRPDATRNNSVFSQQLADRKPGDTITGYFCLDKPEDPGYDPTGQTCQHPDKPNTSILDNPTYTPQGSVIFPSTSTPDTGLGAFCSQNPSLPECSNRSNERPNICSTNPNAAICQNNEQSGV